MILVTGSSGLVGRALVRQLMAQGLAVRSLVHEAPLPRLSRLPGPGPELAHGDVRDPLSLRAACRGAQAVIHLVAVIRERSGADYRTINVEGTRNLLEAAEAEGVKHFALVSALGATPNPRFAYASSKWQAEELVRTSRLQWTIFRPSVLFGDGFGFFDRMLQSLRMAPPGIALVPGKGETRFQPLAAADLARCIRLSLADPATAGETLELGGPQHLTYAEMLRLLLKVTGQKRLLIPIPLPLVRLVAALSGRFTRNPVVTREELEMLVLPNVTDVDVIPRRFGFTPQTLEAGLRALYGKERGREA
ncbi:SDR family oxidoreductase [Limnochorda pilosa]|uniref:Epimerase n=1 Tax=Limnochorda pilosa TaxID=1555112 RepID=A0A0K2SPK5_LIMPI|nr:complex I NDUFA9 subunit family protein [Limnochorda pilosa]BAS28749.1 epimerase [Limnochorda pilosa]